jgi:hypothetical protein
MVREMSETRQREPTSANGKRAGHAGILAAGAQATNTWREFYVYYDI